MIFISCYCVFIFLLSVILYYYYIYYIVLMKNIFQFLKFLFRRRFFSVSEIRSFLIKSLCKCCVCVNFFYEKFLDEKLHKGLYEIYIKKLFLRKRKRRKKTYTNLCKPCIFTANETNFIAWSYDKKPILFLLLKS